MPYQVTWDAPEPRHHAPLEEFYEAHPHAAEAVLVTAANFADALG